VGLNAVFLQPRMGGIETYVKQLVPALLEAKPALELELFVNERGRALLAAEPWAGAVRLVTHPVLGRPYTRALSELTVLGALASRRGLDILHSVALTGPLWTVPGHVLTVGDVTWIRHPDPAEARTTRLWRILVPPVARRADRVVTYSQSSRSEVAEDLGVPLDRIDAIPLGVEERASTEPTPEGELRTRLGLGSGPVVLAVSALKEHKNVGRLVEAMAAVRQTLPDAVLVVPANPTPLQFHLQQSAIELGIERAVVFPGWITDADLEGLYRIAACLAFPSLREGFGLPILDAMHRGLPVACSNTSSLPEVAGDAALSFDPYSVGEIAAAIVKLLMDATLAADLSARGRERASGFTWRRTAEETLATYERAR
jgi:glycosyltransferase involved in cell wall biosynthesis